MASASIIQDQFDRAWNTHDLEGVMKLFTDDAVVATVPPLPGAPVQFSGKGEIRGFVQMLLSGFHVSSVNFRSEDSKVVWRAAVSSDSFRQMGLEVLSADCEAIFAGQSIRRFTVNFTPETIARLKGVAEQA